MEGCVYLHVFAITEGVVLGGAAWNESINQSVNK